MKNSLCLLAFHEAGMRWAAQSGRKLELSSEHCHRLAAELAKIQEDAARLHAAAKLMRDSDRNPWPQSGASSAARAQARKRLDDALAAFESAPPA